MPWFTLVFVIRASQEGQQDPSVPLAPDGLGTATQSLVFVISASQEGQQDPSAPLHLTAPAQRRGTERKHKGFMVVHVPQRSVRRIIGEFGATILSAPPRRSRSFAIAQQAIECYQPC